MASLLAQARQFRLDALLDFFIPAEMQVNPAAHRRARMFMLSHAFGPVIGFTLPLYLFVMDICRDYRVGVFFALILAFWIYPFLLRWTGRYQLLAFISVQNLIFCVFWACIAFGGMRSPFLPWMLIFPLLAFLYLPTTGMVRNILIVQIAVNFALGMALLLFGPLPQIALPSLQVIGMISMACVAAYFAMMSLYFARMFREQQSFSRELNALISTSDNVLNLTASANQASAAKADFVASMSHELRTPLNAIIGYSQLLVEEAMDENDQASLVDLQKVNGAGTQLLRLIDDILDFSRIEAGKMPVTPMPGLPSAYSDAWLNGIKRRLHGSYWDVALSGTEALTTPFVTDWNILGQVLRLASAACTSRSPAGTIALIVEQSEAGMFAVSIADIAPDGGWRPPVTISEEFDHEGDATSSKYGSAGIEMALAVKFARLIHGTIAIKQFGANRSAHQLIIPHASEAPRAAAA